MKRKDPSDTYINHKNRYTTTTHSVPPSLARSLTHTHKNGPFRKEHPHSRVPYPVRTNANKSPPKVCCSSGVPIDRSIDHPPSGHLSHTVPQPSSDFLINVFQFCNVAQVANHPNVYLAKFDDVQNIKVNKFLSTLSFCRHLWHVLANFF
jgi:hypothetical protein